jgi:hypothetical protein
MEQRPSGKVHTRRVTCILFSLPLTPMAAIMNAFRRRPPKTPTGRNLHRLAASAGLPGCRGRFMCATGFAIIARAALRLSEPARNSGSPPTKTAPAAFLVQGPPNRPDDPSGARSRTSFVPATGAKPRHRMRTDEWRCIENAGEFAVGPNERLEVLFRAPTIGNRTTRKPHEDPAIGGSERRRSESLI